MRNEPMRRNELPETCFSILPSSGQLIIIRCGERGYYPSEWDTGNREENREIASSHNVRRGITDIQEAAILAGSMFGWNTPGANPQWYLDNARAALLPADGQTAARTDGPRVAVHHAAGFSVRCSGYAGKSDLCEEWKLYDGIGAWQLCGGQNHQRRLSNYSACPCCQC